MIDRTVFFSLALSKMMDVPFQQTLAPNSTPLDSLLILRQHATSGNFGCIFHIFYSIYALFFTFHEFSTCRNFLLFMWCCFVSSDHNRFIIWIMKRALFCLNSMNGMGKPMLFVCWFFERSIENWFEHNSFEKGIFCGFAFMLFPPSTTFTVHWLFESESTRDFLLCCCAALCCVGPLE